MSLWRLWAGWVIGSAVTLTGCSGSLPEIVSPLLPSHPPPTRPVEVEPPYRKIIADHMPELFAAGAEVHSVRISSARKVDYLSATAWKVCLKAETKDVGSRSSGRTYVLLIQKDQIADRRLAGPSDGCELENYEPLSAG